MKSFSVISINGRSYKCEGLSASIPRIITNESCFRVLNLNDPPMQMTVNVKKSVTLSKFHHTSYWYILDKAERGEIVTLDFVNSGYEFTGLFLIVESKQHKRGSVSFSAVLSGEVTVTEL